MSNSLATLTAQYTDSENEDVNNIEDSENSLHSLSKSAEDNSNEQTQAIKRASSGREEVKKKRVKKVRRLVSYVDDTIVSDEGNIMDESSEESGTEEEDESSNSGESTSQSQHKEDNSREDTAEDSLAKAHQQTVDIEKSSKYAHYKFSLPAEPKGKPAAEILDFVNFMYKKMEQSPNFDMNNIIQRKKEFRNPSIYEKLIQFCKINEFGTNYPPEIYDPLQWGPESYYEELARVQKNEMMKRQKERKDDKIEQATALARKVEEEAKKRKSKWDQPATSRTHTAPLTTTVTGTKGTVISAFGALPKKAA